MKKFIFYIFMVFLIYTAASEDYLKPGETRTYTAKYTVKETDICSDIVNNATVNAFDPCFKVVGPSNDTERVHIKYKADVLLKKVSDKKGEKVNVGDTINYTYYVENIGDVNLTIVSLVDDMIVPVQYISGDEILDGLLNPGEVWIYKGIYKVNQGDLCFDIVNTATLKATDQCHNLIKRESKEVVETTCAERICCQDRYNNKERIDSGKQKAVAFKNGKAKNNVKIVTNQMGGE
jgi:uncharacterized repeat protein (TIGR01451 family)